MSSNFALFLRKKIGKVVRKGRSFSLAKKKTINSEDGRKVTICNAAWLSHRAAGRIKEYTRREAFRIHTNIDTEPFAAPVSQAKDAVIEEILQKGRYTFSHILVLKNPFGEAPLTALALFKTEKPCAVRVTVEGMTDETGMSALLPETMYHRVPLIGLYPGKVNHICLEILENGTVTEQREIRLKAPELPPDLKNIIKVGKKSDDPVFSEILVAGGVDIKTCAFDRDGHIRYFLKRKPKGYGIFPLSKGRFLFMEQDVSAPSYTNPQSVQSYDMDYLGRVRKVYFSRNGIHHTIEEKEQGGNIIAAGSSMEGHSEDLILEIDREDGQIVRKIKVGDLFDDTYQDMMDWAHINSASYYEKDHAVLVSMRNIHSIASFDWEGGQMRWLLADPRFWKGTAMEEKLLRPVGEVPFFYQQHAVFELTDVDLDGNPDTKHIIVFDNHWHKRRKVEFFDKDKLTYISFYTINEKERTVQFYKRFPCPKSKIRSNAILCHKENRLYAMAGSLVKPLKNSIGLIREYDFETEEVLGEYYIKPGFFRAHEFDPQTEALTTALPLTKDYVAGNLKHAQPMPEEEAQAFRNRTVRSTDNEKLSYVVREDVLYVHETDHLIQKVYFAGKKGIYYVDYADTWQTMETFENAEYYIPMWMDTLKEDNYRLILEINGELQNTKKYIRVG